MKFNISGIDVVIDQQDALMFVGVPLSIGANGYVRVSAKRPKNKERYLHRLIMNAGKDDVIDHIDGDKLNNSRSNLRKCNHQQNMCNLKINRNNITGVTGVRWDKSRMLWAAQISAKNKTIQLGRFKFFEEAVMARKSAEIVYHGDFSCSKGAQHEKA